MIDHIVWAVPDFERGVEEVAGLLGVQPTPGGRHTGRGTRNALLSLGNGAYLEVIGPDAEQPAAPPLAFGIDTLPAARLVTWAAKAPDIDARVARAKAAGFDPGVVQDMVRDRPDGVRLHWRLTRRETPAGDGLVPFLIDWGGSPHPAETSAQGCTLIALEAEHPDAVAVSKMVGAVGESLAVAKGPVPALAARIRCPRGEVVLR